jgi:hypothetical protein
MKNVFVLVTIPSKFYLYSEKKVQKKSKFGSRVYPFPFLQKLSDFQKEF